MKTPLIPDAVMAQLIANGAAEEERDPVPPLKLFNPVGPGRWLITEIMADADTLFGLCDLDQGFPELGYVSLDEIEAVALPHGFRIERDRFFVGRVPLSMWAQLARRLGSIFAAEGMVRLMSHHAKDGPS
ncbi:DUF2958 domain-containing protein [Caulobacter sp. UC70_42]|uniref:DUF2958 domain-containing protein n=1 Tax=Caulobacter sp. UC70_42 TaxID=3374551 RepID=UPI003756FFF3